MCYGAIPWAGVRCLLIGASKSDVESLTDFDEGPLPDYWRESLRKRGVELVTDLLREDACAVLRQYAAAQGETY
jgi:tRNA(Arg) A34 adenosine deaminase TadA